MNSHRTLMGRSIWAIFILVLPVYTQAQDPGNGQLIHDKHCTGCHTTKIYIRGNRIVNNYTELLERIRQCEIANQFMLFEEEIKDLATYVNDTFYKFETDKTD